MSIDSISKIRIRSSLLLITRILAVCYFIFTLYALFHPHPHIESFGIHHFSFIHTAAFFVLGGIFELARGQIPFLPLSALLFIYGPLTECIQPFTGRFFEWSDIAEDLIGVTIGILTLLALKILFKKWVIGRQVHSLDEREKSRKIGGSTGQ